MAFGTAAQHLFGSAVGPPAMYAVVAMGGVFAAAAQAPLTAIASVAEMTGNFGLTLPIMLGCGIASALSKHLSYGSIYTTKLLRRGIDIERPQTTNVLQALTVADVMQPIPQLGGEAPLLPRDETGADGATVSDEVWGRLAGPVSETREPQELFPDETLEQALRQLALYGRAGLPVLSHDGHQLQGWVTRQNVLRALAQAASSSGAEVERGAIAADFALEDPKSRVHTPTTPLRGYEIVEVAIGSRSPALGRPVGEIAWPAGSHVVAVTDGREVVPVRSETKLRAGERVILLAPAASPPVETKQTAVAQR
jgi:chloride channel protein, CIC family